MRLSAKLAAVGMTMATVSGTGMFSLTEDMANTENNTVNAPTFTPAAHDIGAVAVASSGSCPTAASGYDADDVLPAVFSGAGLSFTAGGGATQDTDLCIRNNGTQPIDLRIALYGSAPVAHSVELGTCEASESGAGDTTCAAGADGEIAFSDMLYDVNVLGGSSAGCFSVSNAAVAQQSPNPTVLIAQNVQPGTLCRLWLHVEFRPNLTDTEKLLRQTDNYSFRIGFKGSDATGPA